MENSLLQITDHTDAIKKRTNNASAPPQVAPHRRKGGGIWYNNRKQHNVDTNTILIQIQIQTWYKYKYLIEGRVEEFDTAAEKNTMSIQILIWYKYKYFTTGSAGEFEKANETPDQTNVTFYMTQCIVHFNSTQYWNWWITHLRSISIKDGTRPLTSSMHEIQRLTMSRLR